MKKNVPKRILLIVSILLFRLIIFAQNTDSIKVNLDANKEIHFQIKKENPAYGLSLLWFLPEEQIQKIVGKQFKPIIKDGKGVLMLFIASSEKYFLDNVEFQNLKIAHILIPVERSLNSVEAFGSEKQKLNLVLNQYDFKPKMAQIELILKPKNDSISLVAKLSTKKGNLELSSVFLNQPGDLKSIKSSSISSPIDSNCYFMGSESYRPITIESIKIIHKGKNWISEFNLPLIPDRIWLNQDFCWDFIFVRNINTQ